MLFNKKTISTLVACSLATLIPMQAQAISATSYQQSQKEKTITSYENYIASTYYGQASWYGPGFYGNSTANGETYRPGSMTAAHRHLPFGTKVRVTNLQNGRSAVVRINDRGPYVGGRIIDLGQGAASVLGVTSTGTAPVRLEVLN